jgi:hypothetical protein
VIIDEISAALSHARTAYAREVDRGKRVLGLDDYLAVVAARVVAARLNRCRTWWDVMRVIVELEGTDVQ